MLQCDGCLMKDFRNCRECKICEDKETSPPSLTEALDNKEKDSQYEEVH